jgi:hypothetical protein
LTDKGRQYAALLGKPTVKRFRPSEDARKAGNFYFVRHTLLINDVLIAARLLTTLMPSVVLTRLYTERELKRKIYVELPEPLGEGKTRYRKLCIEPDASLRFTIAETWQDFFHIEVYRNLPPVEQRFKQKVSGYVATVRSGQHQKLFHMESLNIAVFAQTPAMAQTLKDWIEEALATQPDDGGRFFFSSLAVSKASPTEMYLSPVWQQAFGTAKTPLLLLDEETEPA